MPRSRSIAIQSERVARRPRLAFTCPARLIAPPNSSSFSVSVVLPASGCEMIAKVRRRSTAAASGDCGIESDDASGLFTWGMWQGTGAGSRERTRETAPVLCGAGAPETSHIPHLFAHIGQTRHAYEGMERR